jgi:hypothetical protein
MNPMKKYLFVFLTLISIYGRAQISLVGAAINPNGGIDILKWEALDPNSVETYPSILDGYYMASSVFDAYHSLYYLSGISADSSGLYAFNTATNSEDLSPFNSFSNITEIDMSTGKIYNLGVLTDSVLVNEYDIKSGTDSLLGVIDEEGIQGVIIDASGFNSNDGIMYFVGIDGLSQLCLFSINVREPEFSYSKTVLITEPDKNYSNLNYDNLNNELYAMAYTYDPELNQSSLQIVRIDPESGEINADGEIGGFIGFVAGSSSFDQLSSSFLFIGVDTSYMTSMIVYNTLDNSFQAGFVPDGVSEVVCDNAYFALNNYILTTIREEKNVEFSVFPNPARDHVTLYNLDPRGGSLILSGINGSGIMQKDFQGEESIKLELSSLPKGIYLLQLVSGGSSETRKIVLQ